MCHMTDREVGQDRPGHQEDQHRAELHTLGKRPDHKSRSNNDKSHLEHDEDRFRDGPVDRIHAHVLQEEEFPSPDEPVQGDRKSVV